MNNMTSNDISKLETLPNELLIGIFTYITPRDLMCGFWNLNYRLNDMMNSTKICLTMVDRWYRTSKYSFSSYYFYCLNFQF